MATFNPDNVMMYESKEGEIPDKYNELILGDVMENSKVMQLGKYEEMNDKENKFEYFAEGPGAYWVNEAEKIKTSKPKWLQVTMVAKKLGVIIPVSNEYLNYKKANFFTEMQSKIAEAFYKKFDASVLLNKEGNPFPQSLEQIVQDSGKVIQGDLDYDNILELEDLLTEDDIEPNAFLSTRKNRSLLRGAGKLVGNTTEFLFDRANNTLDGLPVADLKALEKGELFTGDFNHMFYGIPNNIKYKISEDAQLSTLENGDGTPVNLFEQDLVALRATMDIAFMIVKDESFAKIEPSADEGGEETP